MAMAAAVNNGEGVRHGGGQLAFKVVMARQQCLTAVAMVAAAVTTVT
jgi:hypothetical protein